MASMFSNTMFPAGGIPATANIFNAFPATSSILSAYMSISTTLVLFRSLINQLIPKFVQDFLYNKLHNLFSFFPYLFSNDIVLKVEEHWSLSRNELYDATTAYLSTITDPECKTLRVGKTTGQTAVTTTMVDNETVRDSFQGVKLSWYNFVSVKETQSGSRTVNERYYTLTFDKKHQEKIMDGYLKNILNSFTETRRNQKKLKLYTLPSKINGYPQYRTWKAMDFRHPSTFDTIAMAAGMKEAVLEDLNRFLGRKSFYTKVGRAWKRGYLLYGPPGTGKSSLIAAMANYLKFDVYDLELSSIQSNAELRKALLTTSDRSILVIEDIDCSSQVQNRAVLDKEKTTQKSEEAAGEELTLSGLLNSIDGLWSSCAEERIIVFTTNHKEQLDPALLRPGRMDMHINLSYCTRDGLRVLAKNYHDIGGDHPLFQQIDPLLEDLEITPAMVAEELMKSDDPDFALQELLCSLQQKQIKTEAVVMENGQETDTEIEDGNPI